MGERKKVPDEKEKQSVCMYHSVDFTSFKHIFNAAEKTFSHKKVRILRYLNVYAFISILSEE